MYFDTDIVLKCDDLTSDHCARGFKIQITHFLPKIKCSIQVCFFSSAKCRRQDQSSTHNFVQNVCEFGPPSAESNHFLMWIWFVAKLNLQVISLKCCGFRDGEEQGLTFYLLEDAVQGGHMLSMGVDRLTESHATVQFS